MFYEYARVPGGDSGTVTNGSEIWKGAGEIREWRYRRPIISVSLATLIGCDSTKANVKLHGPNV